MPICERFWQIFDQYPHECGRSLENLLPPNSRKHLKIILSLYEQNKPFSATPVIIKMTSVRTALYF